MEINVPSFFLITKGVLIIFIKSMIYNDSNIQIQSIIIIIISNDLRSIFLNRSLFNFPLLPTISKILHGSLLWDEFEISRVEDISLGYKGGLDEDVAEKYDPSGVASGRTSQISDRYISLGMNCP